MTLINGLSGRGNICKGQYIYHSSSTLKTPSVCVQHAYQKQLADFLKLIGCTYLCERHIDKNSQVVCYYTNQLGRVLCQQKRPKCWERLRYDDLFSAGIARYHHHVHRIHTNNTSKCTTGGNNNRAARGIKKMTAHVTRQMDDRDVLLAALFVHFVVFIYLQYTLAMNPSFLSPNTHSHKP